MVQGKTVKRREKVNVIENNGQKKLSDWENQMRIYCTARRPDLTLEYKIKK